MITLSNIFSQYDIAIDPALSDASVGNIRINREKRLMTIDLHPTALVKRSVLFSLEKAIANGNVGVDKAVVNVRYSPEMFDLNYFGEIVDALRAETPSYNGTLNDAELEKHGNDTLTVILAHGGAGLLEQKGFCDALSSMIEREFGLHYQIEFGGVTELKADDSLFVDSINNAQKKIERKKLEELTRLFEDDEKTTSKANNNQKAEIEIRKGNTLYPQIIPSTVKPLYGRIGKGKMMSIESIQYDTGRATVWGDVFETETKTTRSGDKNIITLILPTIPVRSPSRCSIQSRTARFFPMSKKALLSSFPVM